MNAKLTGIALFGFTAAAVVCYPLVVTPVTNPLPVRSNGPEPALALAVPPTANARSWRRSSCSTPPAVWAA
jgi:hypothetical protein